jgi:hypothetical protein
MAHSQLKRVIMKVKFHHLIRNAASRRVHTNHRRNAGGRHAPRRHYTAPVGNRSEALHYLEEIFGVNDATLSPDAVLY